MRYIYLDWQVFQYMKHETVNKGIDGIAFRKTVSALSSHYHFPFSLAHVMDFVAPEIVDEAERAKDVDFLRAVSKNAFVNFEKGPIEIISYDVNEVLGQAEKMKGEVQSPEIDLDSFSEQIELSALDKSHPFYGLLEETGGSLDEHVFKRILELLYEKIDDPAWYKRFRAAVSGLKASYKKTCNSILAQDTQFFRRVVLPLLEFFTVPESQVAATLRSAIDSLLGILGLVWEPLPWVQKIEMAYLTLDFHPNFRDRIRGGNKPSNMHRDAFHLALASAAERLVTEDVRFRKKAEVVIEALKMDVKVVAMSDFLLEHPISKEGD